VNAIKPKPKATGLVKFQGFVMHANIAQVTVRAKDDERAIQSFPLGEKASAKCSKSSIKAAISTATRSPCTTTRVAEGHQVQG